MRIEKPMVEAWRGKAEAICAKRNLTLSDIKTGRDAWDVAHMAGLPSEAYQLSRDIHDAHIVTALKRIFPNAVFKDRY